MKIVTSSIQKHIAVMVLGISMCFGMMMVPAVSHAQSQTEVADQIRSLNAMIAVLQQQSTTGSTVQYERVSVRENLSVRAFPGGPLLTVLDPETSGTVLYGPSTGNGFDWQYVMYDNGVVGWSADEWLVFSGETDENVVPAAADVDEKCTTAFGDFGSGTIVPALVPGVPPAELASAQFICKSTQWNIYEPVEVEAELVDPGTPGSCAVEGVNYADGSTTPSIVVSGITIQIDGMEFICTNGVLDLQPVPERLEELELLEIDSIQVARSGDKASILVILASGKRVTTTVPNNDLINRVISFLVDENNLDISAYEESDAELYEAVSSLVTINLDGTSDNPLPEVGDDIDDSDAETAVVIPVEEEEEDSGSNNAANGRSVDATPVTEETVNDQDDPTAEPVIEDDEEEEEEVFNNGR